MLSLAFAGCTAKQAAKTTPAAATPAPGPAQVDYSIPEAVLEANGQHWRERTDLFKAEAAAVAPEGIVFLGDSLTEAFPFAEMLPEFQIVNRGIAGERIEQMTQRVGVSIHAIKPARVFIMAGCNDILANKKSVAELVADYDALIAAVRQRNPKIDILVQSVLPIRNQPGELVPKVVELNAELRQLAWKRNCQFVDLYSLYRDRQRLMRAEYTTDGIQLNSEGYKQWAARLRPLLARP